MLWRPLKLKHWLSTRIIARGKITLPLIPLAKDIVKRIIADSRMSSTTSLFVVQVCNGCH